MPPIDTVIDARRSAGGNGFMFVTLTRQALVGVVRDAVQAFRDNNTIEAVIGNALQQRNDWSDRVGAYERVYGFAPQREL